MTGGHDLRLDVITYLIYQRPSTFVQVQGQQTFRNILSHSPFSELALSLKDKNRTLYLTKAEEEISCCIAGFQPKLSREQSQSKLSTSFHCLLNTE
jgi:hypothetical protein